jgi:ligand-binding SRPBCC domain-containing protein
MVIQETITIDAPLSVVWQTFSRMEDWDSWNTACRNCCIISGDEALSAGTCFSFTIRPLAFPLKVRPRIVRCDPGREVVWEGGKWGIHASHTWQFQEENGKVILLSVEQFKGPMVWAGRLLQVPSRLHRLTREFLHTLKNAAEACSGST